MSCIIVLPVAIPIATALWPIVAAAVGTAATTLGFAAVSGSVKGKVKVGTTVDVAVSNAEAVAQEMTLGQEMVFTRGDVTVHVLRDNRGKLNVKVHGESQGKAELAAIGKEFCDRIAQQYAYHRLVSELKQRGFNTVEETVEEDGAVRVKVRIHQG